MSSAEKTATGTARGAEICNIAARFFASDGVRNTSMADIAGAVGIQKPSLYYFFASKEELLVEVLRPVVERPYRELEVIVGSAESIRSRFVDGMAALGEAFEREPDRMQILVRERLRQHLPYESYAEVQRWKAMYTALWRRLIRQGIASGEFTDVDDKLAAFALIGAMNWMHAWFDPEGEFTGAQVGRWFADYLLSGFLAPAARCRPAGGDC